MISQQYDCLLKMVLLGDSSVGKTSFFESFLHSDNKTDYPTIGVDFGFRTVLIGNKIIKIQLWDTAGQERFRSIISGYYRDSDIVVLMYDITNQLSFENIDMWYNNIKNNTTSKEKPYHIILVGNKKDLYDSRVISYAMGKEIADIYGMEFIEVSYKDYNELFTLIDKLIKDTLEIKNDIISSSDRLKDIIDTKPERVKVININLSDSHKPKTCCY